MNDYVALRRCVLADGTRLGEGDRATLGADAARYPLAVGWIAPAAPERTAAAPAGGKASAKPAGKRRDASKKKAAD